LQKKNTVHKSGISGDKLKKPSQQHYPQTGTSFYLPLSYSPKDRVIHWQELNTSQELD
jgi:hypothetical protein